MTAERIRRSSTKRAAPSSTHDEHPEHETHAPAAPVPLGTAVVGREGGALDTRTSAAITSARGGGAPLKGDVRRRMEDAFGTDLGAVRIHDDPRAAQLNTAVSAKAFTIGQDVFFGQGQFAPHTPVGERVLAHELAHTLQPAATAHRLLDPTVRRFGSAPKADEGTTDAEIEIRSEHANSLDWTKATKVGVSSDGAMGGVVFATVDGVPYVLKPGEGSPANALFAEEVLQVVGGAQHTETAPLLKDSKGYKSVVQLVRDKAADKSDPKNDRWVFTLKFFESSHFVMVQKSMLAPDLQGTDAKGKAKAGNASAEAARDNDITALLDDRAFIHNVGRVLVADMLLGNADRFEQVNGGNFFYLGVGKVGAIDNEAFCPSLEEVEKFVKTDRGEGVGRKATGEVERDIKNTWVNVLTGAVESSGVHKEAPMGSPQYLMTSFEDWAKKRFAGWATSPNVKPAAREKLLGIYGDPADAKSWAGRSKGWGRVLADLSAGYEEGLKRLVANLNGPKGTSLLERAKELTHTHGADPVGLDYGALEVRAAYIDVMAKTHDTAKAWDAARETAERRGCTEKVARVLDFAQTELNLDPTRVTKLKIMFSALPAATQESLVSIRPGTKKRLDVFGSKNDAWEILRGKLLLRFELDVEMKSERAKKQVDVMTCGAVEAALKRAADIKAAFKSGSKVERAKIEKLWGVGPLT